MKTMYEFNAVHRENPNASSCRWDYSLAEGISRLAEWYGHDLKDYEVTVKRREESGEWVEV